MALHSSVFAAHAAAEITSETSVQVRETFLNPDCARTGTCSLKEFTVEVTDEKVTFDGGSFALGPGMVARYRTSSVPKLRDYVIVQFIKGCLFSSEVGKDGKVERLLNIARDHYGKTIEFKHPEWAVDSMTTDPAYWSDPKVSRDRHFSYLWNRKAGSTDPGTAVLFGKSAPARPELYVTDSPSGASSGPLEGPRSVTNASLKFSTCIYRAQDVPRDTPSSGAGLPEAIHCVDWSSSHVFNHRTNEFESPSGIDPFCL
jgi:hypothetical protein